MTAVIDEWLGEHDAGCRRTVHRWMSASWAVPTSVVGRLWGDPAWRGILRGVVVGTRETGVHGDPVTVAGLLLDADADRVEVLGLDGGIGWIEPAELVFVHRADIPDVDLVRKVADAHDIKLETGQLVRRAYRFRLDEYERASSVDWVRRRGLWSQVAPVRRATDDYPKEEAVRVRVYRHPELGDRPVIRLLTDTAGAGADLHAARIGCPPPEVGPPVLAAWSFPLPGYPAWALEHDPEAEDEAWEALQALQAARRLAVTRPKQALEAVRTYADTKLPSSHAPAFWFEASWLVFDSSGDDHWTDQAEGIKRSREATDACRRTGMFKDLDFWYEMARHEMANPEECCAALARRDGPLAAYEAYRRVRLRSRWTPWLGKDMRDFAAAAGCDDVDHQAAEVAEYMRYKGNAFMGDTIMKSRRKAFVRLAQTDDHCLRLLFRSPYQLTVFERNGVFAPMMNDPVVRARLLGGVLWPGSSAAEWVNEHYGEELRGNWPSTESLGLLALLAPTLTEGVRLADDEGRANLNSLDLACEHGIPLAGPVREISLTRWYRFDGPRRRSLAHVGADPRYRELLKGEIAAFDGAPDPPGFPLNRPKPPPFRIGQLLELPALAPLVAEVFPELASSVGGPADSVLRTALAGFGVLPDQAPEDRISTVRSMRAAAARLRGTEFDWPDDAGSIGAEQAPAVHWALLLPHLGALAVRAVSPATPEEERAALVEFLALWATMPFVAETGRRWQYGTLSEIPADLGEAVPLYRSGGHMWFVRPAPDGPDPLRAEAVHDLDPGWATRERLEAFVREVTERGPVSWGKPAMEEAERLAEATDWSVAAATLVLAGLPAITKRGGLSPDQRKALKLKASEDTAAYRALALEPPARLRICAAIPPDDPATWWTKSAWRSTTSRITAVHP